MIKYIRLFLSLVSFNLKNEMEFRQNFYIRLITQIFYVGLNLVLVSIFFQFTDTIGTWTKNEVFVLVGMFRLVEGAFHMFFQTNILGLPELIRWGELDLLLTKPANPLFFVSLKRHQLYEFSTFFSGLIIIWYTQLVSNFNWLNIISLSILGLIVLYDIMLFFASFSFFVPKLTALGSIWDVLSKTARFPLDIFFKYSKVGLIFVAPLILIVTLPSQIVLGKLPLHYYLAQIIGTMILTLIAIKFWHFSLRHYSSASS